MLRIFMMISLLALPIASHAIGEGKRQQVEELLELMNMDSMMDGMYAQMDQMMKNMGQQLEVKPSEKEIFDRFTSRMVEVMKSEMSWGKLKEPMIDLYLRHYTEKEIQDMAAFYRSESGRSMIDKMPVVMQDAMKITQQSMATIMPKIKAISQELQAELSAARKNQ